MTLPEVFPVGEFTEYLPTTVQQSIDWWDSPGGR